MSTEGRGEWEARLGSSERWKETEKEKKKKKLSGKGVNNES